MSWSVHRCVNLSNGVLSESSAALINLSISDIGIISVILSISVFVFPLETVYIFYRNDFLLVVAAVTQALVVNYLLYITEVYHNDIYYCGHANYSNNLFVS